MRWQIAAVNPGLHNKQRYEVLAVAKDGQHRFSKTTSPMIRLLKGKGVEGDAHCGEKVQHRSRVRVNPDQPNLRQVHLIAEETLEELSAKGFAVEPSQLGENITTRGIDLLSLPENTHLSVGDKVILTITGLRNPCQQLNEHQPGLMQALLGRDENDQLLLKAGVMAVVTEGGEVKAGDPIKISYPAQPHKPLVRV